MQALYAQLLVGLINGSFYALLSLGLAVIFGMLNIINFAHGALYMMGAFFAWMGLEYLGLTAGGSSSPVHPPGRGSRMPAHPVRPGPLVRWT